MYGVFVNLNNMNKTSLKWQQKYWFSNQWEKAYLIRTKKWKVKKSIAGFEPASFNGPVRIQKFCNAIPTRQLGTLKVVDVKYIYTWTC